MAILKEQLQRRNEDLYTRFDELLQQKTTIETRRKKKVQCAMRYEDILIVLSDEFYISMGTIENLLKSRRKAA